MPRIHRISTHPFHVSVKTNWFFICIQTDTGQLAWGEASLNGWEPLLEAAAEFKGEGLVGLTVAEANTKLKVSANDPGGLVVSAVISALQQALTALMAQAQGLPVYAVLGPQQRSHVPVYANINRATTVRQPTAFAQTALRAQSTGHRAFKAAPFDGVTPANCHNSEGRALIRHGIDCMLAIRDAVGPQALLMVDCHWRFDEAGARQVLQDLAPAGLHWLECPIAELPTNWASIRRIRSACQDAGVFLAAAETQVGLQAFESIFQEKLYDVVMPDVKYCGGPREMLAIAEHARLHNVRCAPHNPTGPICTLFSLHVAAAALDCHMLELQFEESPLYDELICQPLPSLIDGSFRVPNQPGLGCEINVQTLQAHPYQAVPFGIETLMAG